MNEEILNKWLDSQEAINKNIYHILSNLMERLDSLEKQTTQSIVSGNKENKNAS